MNTLEKIKRIPFVLGVLSVVLIIGIVYAADYYQVNSGAQVTIDMHSVCKKVTNNNALGIFVPTKTEAEWTAFRTNASGVTLAECGYCQDSDGDGYGVCPNCNIANGCTYDGNDCCDSDNRAYPGETTYYTSTNNCSSWDYNCSGGTDKSSSCTYNKGSWTGCSTTCYWTSTCGAGTHTGCTGCTLTPTSLSCGASGTIGQCSVGCRVNPGCVSQSRYYQNKSAGTSTCSCK